MDPVAGKQIFTHSGGASPGGGGDGRGAGGKYRRRSGGWVVVVVDHRGFRGVLEVAQDIRRLFRGTILPFSL